MTMTREEAIERYEGIRYTVACFTGSKKDCDAVDMAFSTLRPVSREQVEKVFGAKWYEETYTTVSGLGRLIHSKKYTCSACGKSNGRAKTNFCPACGRAMTNEAVQMVMERLEALNEM